MSEADVKWYPVEDWSTVKVGERVRLSRVIDGEREGVEGVVEDSLHEPSSVKVASVYWYQNHGWALSVTRPPAELPTEPGLYVDSGGDPWRLDRSGCWRFGKEKLSLKAAAAYAPFTRLHPEGDEAREVLGEIGKVAAFIPSGSFSAGNTSEYRVPRRNLDALFEKYRASS